MGNNQSREKNIYRIEDKFSYSNFPPEKKLKVKEEFMKSSKKWGETLNESEKSWNFFESKIKEEVNFAMLNGLKEMKNVICPNRSPFNEYKVGDYVYIRASKTSSDELLLDISSSDDMWVVGKVDSEGKVRDSEGNILKATNEYLGGVDEIRQQQLAAAEYSRWVTQTQSWTSWNMQ